MSIDEIIEIGCIYVDTFFRNEEDAYTIFKFITNDGEICKGSGNIPAYSKGTPLKITGRFVIEKNSRELRFITEKTEPYSDDRQTTINFLSSDMFKGIGQKTAEKIVDNTGTDIFGYIRGMTDKNTEEKAKELSALVKELSYKKALKLIIRLNSLYTENDVYEFIKKYGGTFQDAIKIVGKFDDSSIDVIKDNPYCTGILNFYIADAIAKGNEIGEWFSVRMVAIAEYAVKQLNNSGDTYSDFNDIVKQANKIVKNAAYKNPLPQELIKHGITESPRLIIADNNRIYNKYIFNAEERIIKNINRLQNTEQYTLNWDEYKIIEKIEKENNIKYSERQKNTFDFLNTAGIKILTGGPGTGKTTVINGLIEAYRSLYPDNIISLCAPTGRAAQRMSEATGETASTIHKLLEFKPFEDSYAGRNKCNPLDTDLLIVDEASMLDLSLFDMLLEAVKNGATIILCGDTNQLPSVGAGNILHDLIKSEKFEMNELDVIYRQAEDSKIITNAYRIINSQLPLYSGKDFEIVEVDNDIELTEKTVEISKKYIDPTIFQVLSPVKNGAGSTGELNKALQNEWNSNESNSNDNITFGRTKFRKGDKVIFNVNNYELGYLNGDIGEIIEITENKSLIIQLENEYDNYIEIKRANIKDVELAYAITIHKSQGSEFPVVIISLPNKFNMLERRLLYTAATRATKKVIIIATKDALQTAVTKNTYSERKTELTEKIKERTV